MPFNRNYTGKWQRGQPALESLDHASIEAGIQARRTQVLGLVNPKVIPSAAKIAAYNVVAAGEAGVDTAAHRARIVAMIASADTGDAEVFPIPCYARYILKFNSRFSATEGDRIKAAIAAKVHSLFDHGTLNHAVMRCTSYYLLAQHYPDIAWKGRGGRTWTSVEVMATCKSNYLKRITRFTENGGHAEITSSTYSIINLMCALNLIDFCTDPEMKAAALKEAVLEVCVLRANSHHGTIVAPITRRNVDQLNAPDNPETYTTSVGQQILWFYYGEPAASNYELMGNREPLFVGFLASSPWRPPAATYALGPGEVRLNVPSFSQWDGLTYTNIVSSSYICDEFAIGSSNAIFEPAKYSGWQTFSINWKSIAPQNQISCYHPYWESNYGEDNWTASTNRWSPFQQMHRFDRSSVIMLFNIPVADPWQYESSNPVWISRANQAEALFPLAQYRIPLSADEIDTSDSSGQWVFVRAGNTMIAIGTLNGANEYPRVAGVSGRYKVVKIRQARTAIFWRVESGTDFAAFKVRAKRRAPAYHDAHNPSCSFSDAEGNYTTVTFSIEKVSSTVWSACPVVVKGGVKQARENKTGCDTNNVMAGQGRLIVAAAGLAYTQ